MANDARNENSRELNPGLKKALHAQTIVNRRSGSNTMFSSKNKGKKLLHIGVKH